MRFRAGTTANREVLLQSPIIAVDLGFSQKTRSTGIASRFADGTCPPPNSFTFADGVAHVLSLVRGRPLVTLILEAPLSAQFDAIGNPAIRTNFERRFDEKKNKNVSRPWYSGPGAATLLAALFFLRRMESALETDRRTPDIVLFEGLHTFKSGSTRHDRDATEILDAFIRGDVVDVSVGETTQWLSVLSLLGDESNTVLPSIVTVNQQNVSKRKKQPPIHKRRDADPR